MKSLTAKQRLFVQYYCQDGNGTQAAIKAGYSKDTAGAISSENLQKPFIKDAINYQLKVIMGEIGVDAESIAREIAQVAFAEADHMDTTLKFSDKLKALELLGKYHQMFVDRVETVTIDEVFRSISNNAESSPKHAIKH